MYKPGLIVKARQDAGLTQRELASLIGRDAMTVSRYERGVLTPSLGTLGAIAAACRVSIGDLYDESDPADVVTQLAGEIKAVISTLGSGLIDQGEELPVGGTLGLGVLDDATDVGQQLTVGGLLQRTVHWPSLLAMSGWGNLADTLLNGQRL